MVDLKSIIYLVFFDVYILMSFTYFAVITSLGTLMMLEAKSPNTADKAVTGIVHPFFSLGNIFALQYSYVLNRAPPCPAAPKAEIKNPLPRLLRVALEKITWRQPTLGSAAWIRVLIVSSGCMHAYENERPVAPDMKLTIIYMSDQWRSFDIFSYFWAVLVWLTWWRKRKKGKKEREKVCAF